MPQIDYNLRPAKYVERIMLAQAMRRLRPFGDVESYRYVGFGAAYYRDFKLFHRVLGIRNMVSIEQDTSNQERYEFNVPYSCVQTRFGHSNDVLPDLAWDVKTILWLDYTSKLDREALADITFFAANCQPGSVLIVTVNVQADRLPDGPLQLLVERVGEENVPGELQDRDLTGWGLAKTSRRIATNKIMETLAARNGPRPEANHILFRQLFNFEYADDAKMLTVGGLFHERGQEAIASTCGFESLEFVKGGSEAYRIEVPSLTYKEIQHLQVQLPGESGAVMDARGIPASEVDRFRSIYRYFPVFAPTDV